MTDYAQVYRQAKKDNKAFWLAAAAAIDWTKAPKTALDSSTPPLFIVGFLMVR